MAVDLHPVPAQFLHFLEEEFLTSSCLVKASDTIPSMSQTGTSMGGLNLYSDVELGTWDFACAVYVHGVELRTSMNGLRCTGLRPGDT
jgi:hypothetical protein